MLFALFMRGLPGRPLLWFRLWHLYITLCTVHACLLIVLLIAGREAWLIPRHIAWLISLGISSSFLSASLLSVKRLNLSSGVLLYYLYSRYKAVFPLSSGIVYGSITAIKLYCLYQVV